MANYRPSLLAAGLLSALLLAGCGPKNVFNTASMKGSAQPDKLLYEQAVNDIQHRRYEVARLEMQTLINTYPDSEYLAKAKLAIADSYYKEGGTSGLTQAVAEYQDFITFFPFLDEAAYAQMQIGMAHFLRMGKPDRDHTQALAAEAAFQTFLQKYPKNPYRSQAEQRLREVQEVLAEGEYRIADFYYIRGADRAAVGRLIDLVNRYPLYSKADRANWMLATIYQRFERNEIAGRYYARIVKDYPLSPLVADAKQRLQKLGVPIPPPDPAALALMKANDKFEHDRPGFLGRSFDMLKSSPDVSMASAAHYGTPTMLPADQNVSDSLMPEVLSVRSNSRRGTGITATAGTGAYIQTVSPAAAGSGAETGADIPSGNSGAVSRSDSSSSGDSGAVVGSDSSAGNSGAVTGSDASGAASGAVTGSDSPAPNPAPADPPADSGTQAGSNAQSTSGPSSKPAAGTQKSTNSSDTQNASTSKKKKGLHKILPW